MSATTTESVESTPGTATTTEATAAVIRAWAKENQIEVGDRGKISAEVTEKFNLARVGRTPEDVAAQRADA